MRTFIKIICFLMFGCLILGNCSRDTNSNKPAFKDSTNKEALKIELNGGQMTLDIPAGAMPEDTQISMQESSAPLPETAPVLQQFELLPKGTKFLKPVTLTINYTDEMLQGNSPYALGLAFQNDDDGKWYALVGGKIDTEKKTVSTKITHFSNWGLFSALHLYTKYGDKVFHDGQEVLPMLTSQMLTVGVVMDLPPLSADDEEMLKFIKKGFELMKKDPVNPEVSENCNDCAFIAPVTFTPPVQTDDIHNKIIEPDKWTVNGIVNGNAQTGTIKSYTNGYFSYTSPTKMPLDNPIAIAAVIKTQSHGELQLIQQANVYARKWKLQISRNKKQECGGFDDFGYAYNTSYGGSVEFEVSDGFKVANARYKVQPLKINSAGNCACMTSIHLEPLPETGIFLSNIALTVNKSGYESFPYQILISGNGREYAEFKATWITDNCGADVPHTESNTELLSEEYYVQDFPIGFIPDTPLNIALDEDGEITIEAME